MMERWYIITPRDPVLARDGRPFTADPGALAESLPWPLPTTTAGALRTHIGNANNFDWHDGGPARARRIGVAGPFLIAAIGQDWVPYFPAPLDAFCYGPKGAVQVSRLRPMQSPNGKANFPLEGLLPLKIEVEEKPAKGYDYWSWEDTRAWLFGDAVTPPAHWLPQLPAETRIHVKIDAKTGARETGMLFSTESRCFCDVTRNIIRPTGPRVAMLVRVRDGDALTCPDGFLPIGGERRLSFLAGIVGNFFPLPAQWTPTRYLKLQFITPGLFTYGWRPDWIDEDLRGTLCGIGLTLKSAAIGRRIAVSGWDLESRGPKAARYAVPAGSVYFFEADREIDVDMLQRLWLCALCDKPEDNNDGFGLALPGRWEYANEGETV